MLKNQLKLVSKTSQNKKTITLQITLLTVGLSIYASYIVAKDEEAIKTFLASLGIWAPLVTILIYGILSLTPIPSDPLTLLSGALFGPTQGIFISWMGNNFAALVEYYLGKGVAIISDFEKKKKDLPWGLDKLPANSPWFLIGGRFVPGFGSKIVSVFAGVYNVGVWRYIWTAAASNIVGSALYAWGGAGLVNFFK